MRFRPPWLEIIAGGVVLGGLPVLTGRLLHAAPIPTPVLVAIGIGVGLFLLPSEKC